MTERTSQDVGTEITRKRLATRAQLNDRAHRAAVAQALRHSYEQGASLRQLTRDTGYAYGTVHTLLKEAGTVLRTRGRPSEHR